MLEVIEFALDNTFIRDSEGKLRRQVKGIPMGDPTFPYSPGMCIGACAWMEKEWMNGLSSETKRYFRATRYMDDVLTLVADSPLFDRQEFMNDFNQSECYWKPLRLEDASAGTFLETSFEISNGKCRHWLNV